MKKFLVVLILCGLTITAYARVGVGVKGGAVPSALSPFSEKKYSGFEGLELLWETEAEIDALGIKVGVNNLAKKKEHASGTYAISYWYTGWYNENLSIRPLTFPVTVYYKYKITPSFHVIGGIGVTYAQAKWQYSYTSNYSSDADHSCEEKLFPHFNFGLEWRMSSHFALAADFMYNAKAKLNGISTFGATLDLTGWQSSFVLRFYF